MELSDGLVIEHEWVPGRVLRSPDEDRNNPDSTYQRFLNLPIQRRSNVYDEILELFREIEEQHVIIEDFYDGCVLYDFDADRAHVCDLDHRTNVFTMGATGFIMGATGFILLNDNKRREVDWPLSEEPFRVLAQATSERTEERQESIGQFCREWRRALEYAA
ncbi:MAG: hypothetical protein A2177_10330 [Spirochaetes bacterium RBG_13_68_11]|nr:MAG: hypothetical protein A2177_10330 [Spirochaetes bacterium RBG_13_68_11]